MTGDVFLSAAAFAFAGSFTPGPNNAMLLASGVNFGFRKTLPHIAGIVIGYGIMFAAVTLGLGQIVSAYPQLYFALKVLSSVYLIWLAWRLANAAGPAEGANGVAAGRPMTFLQAVLFQWVNPKGVAMGLVAAASFVNPQDLAHDLPVMLALLAVMSFSSATAWALFGQSVRRFLADSRRLKTFNRAMAVALVLSLWPLLVSNGG